MAYNRRVLAKQKELQSKGYITTKQLAVELEVSIHTIAQWRRRYPETFPKTVSGLYSLELIQEWLQERAKNNPNDSRLVR